MNGHVRLVAIWLESPPVDLRTLLGVTNSCAARKNITTGALERLSKRAGDDRQGWLYFDNILVLAGLEDTEEREFLMSLQPGGAPGILSPYYEQLTLEESTDDARSAADAVAQSLYLQWADHQTTTLLDSADRLLTELRRGRLRYRSRRLRKLVARTLRMEHTLAALHLPNREATPTQRKFYHKYAQRYDLDSRQDVILTKLATLNSIIRAYRQIGSNASEQRLIRFEVLLLAAFPLFALTSMVHWQWLADGLRRLLMFLGIR